MFEDSSLIRVTNEKSEDIAMPSKRFTAVASRLESTLARSVDAPDVDAVHRTRTGSRRLEAALDALERETGDTETMQDATAKLRKLLKKIRKRAGTVRDADVHRALLRKLVPEMAAAGGVGTDAAGVAAGAAATAIFQDAGVLDARLERRRVKKAQKFSRRAEKWRAKLEQRVGAVAQAAEEAGDPPAENGAAELALESFAGLCREIPVLNADTLHEFRKGAKHARYMAEAGEDDWSRSTAKRLKRVQDAIGLWHDWLELAVEARDAGHGQTDLVKRIEAKRDRQFESAMRTTERAKRELLAEWGARAAGRKRPGRTAERAAMTKSA